MSAYPNSAFSGVTSPSTPAEHANITLLPGEQPLFAADFTPAPLLRHIKSGLVVTQDRVSVRVPQYLFFVIRAGYAETSVPIRHICDVTTGRMLSRRRVRSALLSTGIGLFILMSSRMSFVIFAIIGALFAFPLLAFGAFQAWMARSLGLTITSTGGGTVHTDVDKAEYENMLAAANLVQRLVLDVDRGLSATPSEPVPPAETTSAVALPPQPSTVRSPVTPPPADDRSAPPSIWRG